MGLLVAPIIDLLTFVSLELVALVDRVKLVVVGYFDVLLMHNNVTTCFTAA